MSRIDTDLLATTLIGFEGGLRVRHIATFNPHTCTADAIASSVFTLDVAKAFDQIPVMRGDRIVGVLERENAMQQSSAETVMQPLDESILVSADEPLARFLLETLDNSYRLVIDGGKINGIVTWSDILKLPVRLLVFGLVTHLEMLLTALISACCASDEAWLHTLSAGRQEKVRNERDKRRADHLDPPLVELTMFADKFTAVKELYDLGRAFQSDMVKIQKLRDTVAHARGYTTDERSLRDFIATLRLIQEWIEYLGQRMPDGPVAEHDAAAYRALPQSEA